MQQRSGKWSGWGGDTGAGGVMQRSGAGWNKYNDDTVEEMERIHGWRR